jgi:hypothetical protein
MAKFNKTSSPYLTTPTRDFYLDLMVKRNIPPSANDTIVTIEAKYEGRPDKFANDFYGSPRLWWILPSRNMDILIDPIEDFKAGVAIFVPSPASVQDLV